MNSVEAKETSSAAHHVLVIGVGSIGERHLRCFLATRRAALSFVEPNASLRSEIAAKYPAARVFEDLDVALAASVTAAVIATPAPLHISLATRLAEAGVHVLIEKPLALSLDGIDALSHVVQERRLIAAVAYVNRLHPVAMQMRAAIAAGDFGKPVEIVAVCGQNFPTYRPAYRQIYYADRAKGGGAVQDALTHVIDLGQWLVGPIDRLVADAAHQVLDGVEVEDTVHVITRQGSVLGSYSLNQHQAPNEITITVICERGTARFEYAKHHWRFMKQPGAEWTDLESPKLERDELFIRQANAFLDAVERKASPHCTLEEGAQALRANIAILQSVQERQWKSLAK